MRHNDARGCGDFCKLRFEVLKRRKVIEIQSSGIVIYYKIHFRVPLEPICAGDV